MTAFIDYLPDLMTNSTKEMTETTDVLKITPLGAGQEVGRSCILVEYMDKKVMLDCGIHPGFSGVLSLPYIDEIDPSKIDILFVSHFHLDHSGAIPWFLNKTTFKGRVFMTHATKAIYRWLVLDYIKVSNVSLDEVLYTEKDLEATLDRIETIHFHQHVETHGISFTCFHAGHVLGAAMFLIDIAGVKFLYTGDFSRHEDRHLMPAEIPPVKVDVLITESTYGTHVHEKREIREQRFIKCATSIVKRGGRCLIPIFALGRAQEILLILDEYWKQHLEFQNIPIYYASSLAKKCMMVYQTYTSALYQNLPSLDNELFIKPGRNPFSFKYISYLKGLAEFNDVGPSIVLASPGMMQSGLSRELFELWCSDYKNGVIVAGYALEGTLAKEILSEPEEIISLSGRMLTRRCSIDYISFSAHADYLQISAFVEALSPPSIILVHGEQSEMARLKSALSRDLALVGLSHIEIHSPKNCNPISLKYRGERVVKVIGDLVNPLIIGNSSYNMGNLPTNLISHHQISGVIVKNGFSYNVVSSKNLSKFTDMKLGILHQKLNVCYKSSISLLAKNLITLTGSEIEIINDGDKIICVKPFHKIKIFCTRSECLTIEWDHDHHTDSLVETILAVIQETERHGIHCDSSNLQITECNDELFKILTDYFGEPNVSLHRHLKIDHQSTFPIDDDGTDFDHEVIIRKLSAVATLRLSDFNIVSSDPSLKQLLDAVVKYFKCSVSPFCCSRHHSTRTHQQKLCSELLNDVTINKSI